MSSLLAAGPPSSSLRLLWLVPALPLAGAAVNLLAGRRVGRFAGALATALVGAAFVVSLIAVGGLLDLDAADRLFVQPLFEWIRVGSFSIGADLRLDTLSAVMILVVTGVGSLIHLYAIGYMRGDPRYGRFFAYLNLFVFFMLMLVLGQNLLVLYLGWEGVGLCSYLLIGFWFEKTENANAAKKAFVTTRIGDTAMLIGLALIVLKFGTLDYSAIFGAAGGTLTKGVATAIALLLLAGAVGKSAQLPLHVWLPDAMAGPTPVSALIHAATMVTAGVYLVLRMRLIFEISGIALTIVAVVGVATMLYGALSAFGQDDIKRALAYSTMSQVGYMFLAAGLGAYPVALFFLVAHALYKACMFLGAGSVMHGMHEETDLQKMGGLARRMPVTAVTFMVGAFALAGIFPLSGFFAKDQILEVANGTGRTWLYLLGTAGALLSALYIGRVVFLAFWGSPRSEKAERAHESPSVMTLPVAALAVGAATAGLLQISTDGALSRFLLPVTGPIPEETAGISTGAVVGISLALAILGLVITWLLYASGAIDWLAVRVRLQPAQRVLEHGFYIDDYYAALLVTPGKAFAAFTAYVFDAGFIDGVVNGVGVAVRGLARSGRRLQTGLVRTYALAFLAGAIGVLVYVGLRL